MGRRNHFALGLKRFVLKILCTVLGIILAVLVAGTAIVQSGMEQIQRVDPGEAQPLSREELAEFLASETEPVSPDLPTLDPALVNFAAADKPIGGKHSPVINILLIGQDRRPGETRARSDSMILCTVNKETGTLILTSILRDLYVQIPGYGDNRINAAYAAGGMQLLNETLEHNFGIRVDGNVEVDFNQFQSIIDRLGGVSVDLRQDEAELLNRTLNAGVTAGIQKLTGEQALRYARIRSLDSDGDFSRTGRQRKLIGAMIEAAGDAGMKTLLTLVDEILPMITTDMSNFQILSYALELFPVLPELEIVSQHVPADGTYSGKMIRGMAVLVADMDAARTMLERTLLGETGE